MAKRDKIILEELKAWHEKGAIGQELYESLASQYEVTSWDLSVLIRWTLILGAIMLGVGLLSFFFFILQSLALVVAVLTLLCGVCYYLGLSLATGRRTAIPYPKSGNALIAVACLLLCGDIFAIGDLLSTSSGHWTVLLLITTAIYFVLAYLHKNTLVLVFALLGIATWFGTESGYMSGWGAYFLGLNYPMRFAIASPFVILLGVLHTVLRLPVPESFSKAYMSVGLLYLNLSLWIMSIFGNYGDLSSWHNAGHAELLIFSLLWGAVDIGLLVIGSKFQNRMFSGYAIVFLLLNAYTRYFEYFWDELHKSLFFIILGGLSLGLGIYCERWFRRKKAME